LFFGIPLYFLRICLDWFQKFSMPLMWLPRPSTKCLAWLKRWWLNP